MERKLEMLRADAKMPVDYVILDETMRCSMATADRFDVDVVILRYVPAANMASSY